jgi:hypothetical protein
MIGGIEGSFWRWLAEHLGLEGLKWLLKQPFVLMGIDLPIGVWMVLALLAVILVVVLIVVLIEWLVDAINDPPRLPAGLQRASGGQHIWAGVFWALIIVAILTFYYALW